MDNGKVEMLYEDFMDLMEEREDLLEKENMLDDLLGIIFNSVRLGYDNALRIDKDEELMIYLKIKKKMAV